MLVIISQIIRVKEKQTLNALKGRQMARSLILFFLSKTLFCSTTRPHSLNFVLYWWRSLQQKVKLLIILFLGKKVSVTLRPYEVWRSPDRRRTSLQRVEAGMTLWLEADTHCTYLSSWFFLFGTVTTLQQFHIQLLRAAAKK